MPKTSSTPYRPSGADVWILALWCGVVMGLGEGAIFLTKQALGQAVYVSVDIVWAAVIVDCVLALAVAGVFLLAIRLFPRLESKVVLGFVTLVLANWSAVALAPKIQVGAALILAIGVAVVVSERLGAGRAYAMARRSIIPVSTVALLVCIGIPTIRSMQERRAIAQLPPAPDSAPNVLVLLIDTFRADHSSLYGYDRPTTPHIDSFARGGVVFDQAFATASYTLASHGSLLTGLLPHEHGAEWAREMDYWHCDCDILPASLQEKGYATAGFSANPFWFTREYGFARGFHRFEDFFDTPVDVIVRTAVGRAFEKAVLPRLGYLDIPGRKNAALMNERLMNWVDRTQGRPFFAFVNYFDIHDPYLPPEPYRSRFAGHPVGGVINWRINGIDPVLDESVIRDEMDAYDGAITYIDEQIGQLLTTLEAEGLLDNTLVIITSDHGEEFGEHDGLVLHGHSLYVQSTHVPLIIRGPGVPAGERIDVPVSNAALPSTVTKLAFGESTFPMTPLVGGEGQPFEPPVSELTHKPWGSERHQTYHGAMKSVVSDGWHLIRHQVTGPHLYDLTDDPTEQHDVAGSAEAAERVTDLDRLLPTVWDRTEH